MIRLYPGDPQPDPPAFLREDMTLSVEVETARRDRAVVLPLAALRPMASGQATVLVVTDSHAKVRTVQLGLRTLDAAEVLEGLAAGDAVVLRGEVRPDARVRARTVAWQPGAATAAAVGGADVGSALTNAMGR